MFNKGIIHFDDNDFDSAAEFFRKALEVDPVRVDAKRNLELSLTASASQTRSEPAPSSAGGGGASVDSRGSALFDYFRLIEQEKWRSEWAGDSEPDGMDY